MPGRLARVEQRHGLVDRMRDSAEDPPLLGSAPPRDLVRVEPLAWNLHLDAEDATRPKDTDQIGAAVAEAVADPLERREADLVVEQTHTIGSIQSQPDVAGYGGFSIHRYAALALRINRNSLSGIDFDPSPRLQASHMVTRFSSSFSSSSDAPSALPSITDRMCPT